MLHRAFVLQKALQDWISGETSNRSDNDKIHQLDITGLEWDQVRYLLALLKPFKDWTLALSKTTGVTIHKT